MKVGLYAVCALIVIICCAGCTTGGGTVAESAGSVLTVEYVRPENFTDFRVQGRTAHSASSVFTQEIRRRLEPIMRRLFPGEMLTLRFTDIDLAGRRPAGRPGSTRVLRPNTSVRLSFDYVFQDTSGRSVARGSERLVDTLNRTLARYPSHSRPLYFEGQMVQRWLVSLSVTR